MSAGRGLHEMILSFRLVNHMSHGLRDIMGAFSGAKRQGEQFEKALKASEDRLKRMQGAINSLNKSYATASRGLDTATKSLQANQTAQERALRTINDTRTAMTQLTKAREAYSKARVNRLIGMEDRETGARNRLYDVQREREALRREREDGTRAAASAQRELVRARQEARRTMTAQRAELDREAQETGSRHAAERKDAMIKAQDRVMYTAREARMAGYIGDFKFSEGGLGSQIRASGQGSYDLKRIAALQEMRTQAQADYRAARGRISRAFQYGAGMSEEERAEVTRKRTAALGQAGKEYKAALAPVSTEISEMKRYRSLLRQADRADAALAATPGMVDARHAKEREALVKRSTKADEDYQKVKEKTLKQHQSLRDGETSRLKKILDRHRQLDDAEAGAQSDINKAKRAQANESMTNRVRQGAFNMQQQRMQRRLLDADAAKIESEFGIKQAKAEQVRFQDRMTTTQGRGSRVASMYVGEHDKKLAAQQKIEAAKDKAALRMNQIGQGMMGAALVMMGVGGVKYIMEGSVRSALAKEDYEQMWTKLGLMGNKDLRKPGQIMQIRKWVESYKGRIPGFAIPGEGSVDQGILAGEPFVAKMILDLAAGQHHMDTPTLKKVVGPLSSVIKLGELRGFKTEGESVSAGRMMERLGLTQHPDWIPDWLSRFQQARNTSGRISFTGMETMTNTGFADVLFMLTGGSDKLSKPAVMNLPFDLEALSMLGGPGRINSMLTNMAKTIRTGGTTKVGKQLFKDWGLQNAFIGRPLLGKGGGIEKYFEVVDKNMFKAFPMFTDDIMTDKSGKRFEAARKTFASQLSRDVKSGRLEKGEAADILKEVDRIKDFKGDKKEYLRSVATSMAFSGKLAGGIPMAALVKDIRKMFDTNRDSLEAAAKLVESLKNAPEVKTLKSEAEEARERRVRAWGSASTPIAKWWENTSIGINQGLTSILEGKHGKSVATGAIVAGGAAATGVGLLGAGLIGNIITGAGGGAWGGAARIVGGAGNIGKSLANGIASGAKVLGPALVNVLRIGLGTVAGAVGGIVAAAGIGWMIGKVIQGQLEKYGLADKIQDHLVHLGIPQAVDALLGNGDAPPKPASPQLDQGGWVPSGEAGKWNSLRVGKDGKIHGAAPRPPSHGGASSGPRSGADAKPTVVVVKNEVQVFNQDGSKANARVKARAVQQNHGGNPGRTVGGGPS